MKVNLKTETCLQGNQVLLADIMTTLPSSADGTPSEKSESTSLSSHFSLFHSRSSEGKCHPKQSASIVMCDCASRTMSTGAAGSLWSYLADISPVITYQKITLAKRFNLYYQIKQIGSVLFTPKIFGMDYICNCELQQGDTSYPERLHHISCRSCILPS